MYAIIFRKILLTGLVFLSFGFIGFAPSNVVVQTGIGIGDTVEVASGGSNLNLRTGPGLDFDIVGKLLSGTRLMVVDGPKEADGYRWWKIENSTVKGWAAESFLRKVQDDAGAEPTGSVANLCNKTDAAYPGITSCSRDSGQTQVIFIDLNDPHVRFETVIANNAGSVNTSSREFVRDMAFDHPGAAAAINTDYFGAGHGPEGLTIINGTRYSGIVQGDNDNNDVNRSSLAISQPGLDGGAQPIRVQITRLEDDKEELDKSQFYQATGGGPQVVFDGAWEWTRADCLIRAIPDADLLIIMTTSTVNVFSIQGIGTLQVNAGLLLVLPMTKKWFGWSRLIPM